MQVISIGGDIDTGRGISAEASYLGPDSDGGFSVAIESTRSG